VPARARRTAMPILLLGSDRTLNLAPKFDPNHVSSRSNERNSQVTRQRQARRMAQSALIYRKLMPNWTRSPKINHFWKANIQSARRKSNERECFRYRLRQKRRPINETTRSIDVDRDHHRLQDQDQDHRRTDNESKSWQVFYRR
jgi:hypothetical protein